MKKILIVITTAFVPTGGLATVMMNYYRNINKYNLKIDFASTNEAPEVLIDELAQHGSYYYNLGKRSNIIFYFFRLCQLCRNYDVVHINGNSATAAIELLAAWMAGVKVRIDHNHTTKTGHRIIHNILLPLFRRLYTHGLACSEEAGLWLFGKEKFKVLNNAIDTEKYRFSPVLREKYRQDWGIPNDNVVIGHVGKMNAPKNHFKLLEVFAEYHKTHKKSKLLCVGYGELRNKLECRIDELGLQSAVILTGLRTDIPGFLSAMDVFVFPSKFEGLGLAVIEAEASGLPCLLSDRVPQDVYLSSCMKSISLEAPSSEWADVIDSLKVGDRERHCLENIGSITKAGYNITTEAGKLREMYLRHS